MKSKSTIALALIILCVNLAFGQLGNIQGLDNVVIRTKKKYEDIKGSAYLYPTWNSGTITDKSGKGYSNLLLKYDSYKDQIELNQEGQIVEPLTGMYNKFTLNFVDPVTNQVIKHSFSAGYPVEGYTRENYFDLLLDGKITLLKKYKTLFLEESVSGYGTSGTQKSFQSTILYFIIADDSDSKEIKLNKKSVLNAFQEQTAEIEAFIKEKKMKVKSETDLIEIIRFLNAN